jgi:hypothetical protein
VRVLALDPGERVGWATGVIDTGAEPFLEVSNHGISFLKDMALKLHEVAGNYDVIVYETWRLRPNKAKAFIGNEFLSSQFIGMVRLCCWLNPGVKIVPQGPNTKSTADRYIAHHQPDIQRRLDAMPKAHDDGHDGDALRHLAFYYYDKFA